MILLHWSAFAIAANAFQSRISKPVKPNYSNDEVLDPVAAYDRVAPVFAEIALRREAYLRKIEELVIARVPANSRSLLDVGAGDGSRAVRIARAAGIHKIVLLEPSAKMRRGADTSCEIWPIRAEALRGTVAEGRSFDVIICLWNVLGHIRLQDRLNVLRELARLLSQDGMLFVDVNHRYNMRAYGFWRTVGRMAYDRLVPAQSNGDVVVSWGLGKTTCSTYGHVFTQREMADLIADAGLKITEKIFVDYESGDVRRSGLQGNLFYVLRRRA
ncbi:MAG TPA: class I SAM-dependent methyltransferase [Terriglobales bacterium]